MRDSLEVLSRVFGLAFMLVLFVLGIGLVWREGFFTVENGVGFLCIYAAGKVLDD